MHIRMLAAYGRRASFPARQFIITRSSRLGIAMVLGQGIHSEGSGHPLHLPTLSVGFQVGIPRRQALR
jgi:hypothetical protein